MHVVILGLKTRIYVEELKLKKIINLAGNSCSLLITMMSLLKKMNWLFNLLSQSVHFSLPQTPKTFSGDIIFKSNLTALLFPSKSDICTCLKLRQECVIGCIP